MGNKKDLMEKNKLKLSKGTILMLILIIPIIFGLPIIFKVTCGKFTWSMEKAIDYKQSKQMQELDCEWGARCDNLGMCYCGSAPCKTYNTEGKDCVREGYTGSGFLGFTDFDNEYYVCKEYGRIALSCIDYWDSEKEMMDSYLIKEEEV